LVQAQDALRFGGAGGTRRWAGVTVVVTEIERGYALVAVAWVVALFAVRFALP